MKKLFISVSGGKDSTATLLVALQQKDALVTPVFADTGWEHPYVYEYIEYLESKLHISIARVKSHKYNGMLDLIEKKRIFPSQLRRFCTEQLKSRPLDNYVLQHSTKDEILNKQVELWIGIRANESKSRSDKYSGFNADETYDYGDVFPSSSARNLMKKVQVRFPILNFTVQDVYRIITEHGLDVNKLYHSGFDRVGCFPCLMSSPQEFKRVYQDPYGKTNIEKLVELEKKLNNDGYKTRIKPNMSTTKLISIVTGKEQQKFSWAHGNEPQSLCSFCQL